MDQQLPANSTRRQLSSITSTPSISQSDLENLTRDAFDKTSIYVKSQLEGTLDEFKLMQSMNQAATQKYAGMKPVANDIVQSFEALNRNYDKIQPFFEQIDEVVAATKKLEIVACALDNYVKCLGNFHLAITLENKFKQLEKR